MGVEAGQGKPSPYETCKFLLKRQEFTNLQCRTRSPVLRHFPAAEGLGATPGDIPPGATGKQV